jgi:penicillin-binding protein 2
VTALAALQLGVVTPDQKIHCGGGIRLPNGASRKCWAAHGEQDVVSALANSCDTYFYTLGGGDPLGKFPGVGGDRLAGWAQLLGFGKPTGVELPGEAAGLTPTSAWKKATHKEDWYVADDWFSAIGQGFYTSTPIQMATMAAAVANGGTLYMPRLALELTDQRGGSVRRFDPALVGKLPIDDKHIQIVREGVRAGMLIGKSPFGANYTGTSWDSKIPEITMAGKTSTAEYGTEGPDGKLPTHGWFSFWAPHEAPKIAGSVFVSRGRGAQEAAKVAREVVKAYFGIV